MNLLDSCYSKVLDSVPYVSPTVEEFANDYLQKHTSPEEDNLDKIKKLKELLDMGAITQEEFDEKKKELLNL